MAAKKQKPLTAEELAECAALKAAWDARPGRSPTQAAVAAMFPNRRRDGTGINQAAVSMYLNGKMRLNLRAKLIFAQALGMDPIEIWNMDPIEAEFLTGLPLRIATVWHTLPEDTRRSVYYAVNGATRGRLNIRRRNVSRNPDRRRA